jgi:hypothetical protein
MSTTEKPARRTPAQIAADDLRASWDAVLKAAARIERAEKEVQRAKEAREAMLRRFDYAALHPDLDEATVQPVLAARQAVTAEPSQAEEEPSPAEEEAYRAGLIAAFRTAYSQTAGQDRDAVLTAATVSWGLPEEEVTGADTAAADARKAFSA